MSEDEKAKLQRNLRHAVVQSWMISNLAVAVLVAAIPLCNPRVRRGGTACRRGKTSRACTSKARRGGTGRSRGKPPEPTFDTAAASPEPETIKLMPEERPAAAADQLLAFTCCWPELPTAVSVPQPGPGGRQDQPPAWPLILLPLALCAMWSKKFRRLLAPDFVRSSASTWRRWGRVPVRRGAHYVSDGRRAQPPAGGVASSPTNAQRPTKLVRIDGALVPLAPRRLPPPPRGSLSFRSSAKAGDWRRMRVHPD